MTRPGYPSGATPASELAPPAVAHVGPPPRPAEGVKRREAGEIRRCALGNAVEFWRGRDLSADERRLAARIIATAREFESWLSGGEPPDPTGR